MKLPDASAWPDLTAFSQRGLPDHALRPYQMSAALPIVQSVLDGKGEQYAVVFARQAGKDEMLAQLLAFLLLHRSETGGSVVVAAPTLRPQALLSRDRLLARLLDHPATKDHTSTNGTTIRVGKAQATFLSAAPRANARGQTADLALIANETQDIAPDTWDAVFDPMAASTNAPTIFLGTVWSRHTLLARQMRYLREKEQEDGTPRVFLVPWTEVAKEIPAYGERVRDRMAQLGMRHPFIRTEYFLEELDGEQGLFPPHRIAQMRGDHPRQHTPTRGRRYALLLDVAGEEESGGGQLAFGMEASSRRDSTALTVVEVDTDVRADGRPLYRVVDRRTWTGISHVALHAQLVDLATTVWKASWLVVDATGIGAGLASFLDSSLTPRGVKVRQFVFSSASKSQLGWDFLALIDSGRYKEYVDDGEDETTEFYAQLRATEYTTAGGPGAVLRWSVPAAAGHDDLVISASLVTALDGEKLRPRIALGS